MKITIESTSKIVELNDVPARIWEGETESGIKVHCFITRIAHDKNEERADEFRTELQKQKPPSKRVDSYPLSMFIN